MSHYLQELIRGYKAGIPQGIFSVCSANGFVLESLLEFAQRSDQVALVEATSNQVNQFGGYTGMKPKDFAQFVWDLAAKVGFPLEKVILGGDHLGPNPWRGEPAAAAMAKAEVLVREYVQGGFTKIHLDASMHLGDDGDPGRPLEPRIIAQRTALLCQAAERAYGELLQENPKAVAPVYIIGTEVPAPGGTQGDTGLSVTRPEDFHTTVQVTKEAFEKLGLAAAWERVVGVVVQPGVEFGDQAVHEYDREQARELTKELEKYPRLVFEGHSTDYQQPEALKQMVEDGVVILKVGPELTFALREALFLLEHMEQQIPALAGAELSRLQATMEEIMLAEPANWAPYYQGSPAELEFARKYSLSDRIRYYWPHPQAQAAVARLLTNLNSVDLPLPLLSQYLPRQYAKVRAGALTKRAEDLIKDRIAEVYEKYLGATKPA
ncbi:MAG TPA: class II D-tagatose-bisphosphate aldolase, non-catalytic subunit [Limnochordia bacterium]|nr:class II D-tagatose-bisphosphate aldolase, non-catalytic subunit [Limnochordia bacterium]